MVPEDEEIPSGVPDAGDSSLERPLGRMHPRGRSGDLPISLHPFDERARRLERGAPSRSDARGTGAPRSGRRLDGLPLGKAAEMPTISPRMTAVFGGLFGLAVVASVVALLIQVFPVQNQRSLAVEPQGAEPSARPAPSRKARPVRERKLLPPPWRLDSLAQTHQVVRGKMERRAFTSALEAAGVPKTEIYRIMKAMDGVHSFEKPGRRDEFAVAMERGAKRVAAFEYVVDATEIYQARTGDDGLLRGERLDLKVAEEEYATSFYIGRDFQKSYRAAGLEDGLVALVNEAFNGRTSVEGFEEGGVVKIAVVEKTALGAFVGYSHIKAIEYRPPDPSKPTLRAYWFQGEGTRDYVDEAGRRPTAQGWRTPVPGAPVTSHFNPARLHPILKKPMPHNGTDFGAPSGTPVYAAYRGTVLFVGYQGPSGNLVLIEHPGGIETGYAHLSKFATGLKKGDKVGTRQLVGYVGSTGRSTGPHLHFSAKKDGKFFDPLTLKLDALTLLPVEERGTFHAQKAQLDQALEAIPLPEPPEPEPEPQPDTEPAAPVSTSEDSEGDDFAKAAEAEEDSKGPSGDGKATDEGDDLVGDDLSGEIE
jgi:murein DD-endopeptidase MepM/ murein hydrolase activator NlpD